MPGNKIGTFGRAPEWLGAWRSVLGVAASDTDSVFGFCQSRSARGAASWPVTRFGHNAAEPSQTLSCNADYAS
jgi:hypothetical protein